MMGKKGNSKVFSLTKSVPAVSIASDIYLFVKRWLNPTSPMRVIPRRRAEGGGCDASVGGGFSMTAGNIDGEGGRFVPDNPASQGSADRTSAAPASPMITTYIKGITLDKSQRTAGFIDYLHRRWGEWISLFLEKKPL
jgi:hypothetical protein